MQTVRIKWLFIAVVSFFLGSAHAVQLAPLLELNPNEENIKLELINDTESERVYVLTAEETSFPDRSKKIIDAKGRYLLLSPASLKLRAGARGYFNLRYQGSRVEEHYFRLLLKEKSINKAAASGVTLDFPLSIASNLVVRPLNPRLAYTLEKEKLRNTGNAYLLLMQDEDCGRQKGMTAFVAPGAVYALPEHDEKSVLSVGLFDEIKLVRTQCQL